MSRPVSLLRPADDDGGCLQADIDALIRRADEADGAAVDELFALLYGELHRIAGHALRRNGGAITLGATTLLHEAYLNIASRDGVAFADRGRFLAYAARAMRGLIIDYARRRRAHKRGRHLEITLDGDAGPVAELTTTAEELVELGGALDALKDIEPRLAELVDLHFFSGFSFVEIASLRGVTERTIQRDWRKARLLLHQQIREESMLP